MTWLLLGALLALAAHAVASSAAAAAVVALAPGLERRLARRPPAARARGLFVLALSPSLAGLIAVLAVVAPAWVSHEPAGAREAAGPLLWVLGLAGAALLAPRPLAAARLARRTARAVRAWARGGAPVAGLRIPATRIEHPLPVAALAGTLRPRLLLASRLVDALTADELQAVAAHERAHAAAGDNLRRLALAASPDALAWLPAGRRFRAAFEEAAEFAADERARREVRPEALARALVVAASLVPDGGRLALPLAALDAAPLAARVRVLLADGPAPGPAPAGRGAPLAVAAAVLGIGALAAWSALRPEAHALLEAVVRASS
ncbi:MAG: M48 family metalloprotease [Vicinamibacteria bacterium]